MAFLVALYCAWLSAGRNPWDAAYEGARAPSDFLRDFVAAMFLARGEPLSKLDGARGNAEAVRLGAEPVIIIDGSPFHLHPPPASLPTLLLVPFGFRGASMILLGLSIVLLGVLAHLLVATKERVGGRAPLPRAALFGLLVLWPPTLTNLELGQWSILLAVLIAVGFHLWEARSHARGAVWIAAAAALKLTPAAVFPFVALRDRRAAALFVGVVLVAVAIAWPLAGGLDAWTSFHRDAGTNVLRWQTWWHNTLSLNGLLARLFTTGRFHRPIIDAPPVGRGLLLVAAAALVAIAWRATRAAGVAPSPAHEGCVFALWNVLTVVLNPLGWTHYALLLLLPATLVLRAADEPASPLPPETRARLRRAVAVAIVGLTIPKESLYLVTRPLPTTPLQAPVMSLHLFAALLLFAAAAQAARALGKARRFS